MAIWRLGGLARLGVMPSLIPCVIPCVILGLGLGACTVSQLKQDTDVRQSRVAAKENLLAGDAARQDALRAESRQLEVELRQWESSLDALQSELDRLQRQTALAGEQTRQQSLRKEQLAQQLEQFQQQADMLRRNGNGNGNGSARLPVEARRSELQEKQKRLKHLQGEVRKALELLLNS